jgi:hypothetical protein
MKVNMDLHFAWILYTVIISYNCQRHVICMKSKIITVYIIKQKTLDLIQLYISDSGNNGRCPLGWMAVWPLRNHSLSSTLLLAILDTVCWGWQLSSHWEHHCFMFCPVWFGFTLYITWIKYSFYNVHFVYCIFCLVYSIFYFSVVIAVIGLCGSRPSYTQHIYWYYYITLILVYQCTQCTTHQGITSKSK